MEIIYYLGVSHAIFGFAILLTKRPKHISNQILGIWILFLGIVLSGKIIPVPVVTFFKPGIFPIYICFGPFMYLYIKSLTIEDFKFTKTEFLHFIPFILIVIHRSFTDPVNIGRGGGHNISNEEQIANFVYYSLVTISLITYTIITLNMINKHKSNLQNIYSYKDSRYTLNWTTAMAIMFLLIFTLSFMAGTFNSISTDIYIPYRLRFIGSVVFIIVGSFFGINQPVILIQPHEQDFNDKSPLKKKKYLRSGLSKTDMQRIESQVMSYLKQEKPYLNPQYNINLLSDQVGIPRHHITQVINIGMGKNFYSLINELRILEVIDKLNDPKSSNLTLLAIAFDCGFNSKSAFNRSFKQSTGKTPSDFKSSQ